MLRARNVPAGMTVAEVNAYINYMAKQHPEVKSGVLDIEFVRDVEKPSEEVSLMLIPDSIIFERRQRAVIKT